MKAPLRLRVLRQIQSYRRIAMDIDVPEASLSYRGEPLFTANGELINNSKAVFMTNEEIAKCIGEACGGFENE